MTNVTKEEYWTTILNDPTQIGQITTEDTEFNRRINDVNLVLSNTFINSSDENIISRWESSLYIDDIEGKTIIERKADILYALCEKNYVPMSIIKRFLLNLIGDENKFVVEFIKDENKLVIHTDRIFDDMNESVSSLLEGILPQNIKVVRYNHDISIPWQEIPEGFTVVDYLESTGTQCLFKAYQAVEYSTLKGEWVSQYTSLEERHFFGYTGTAFHGINWGGNWNFGLGVADLEKHLFWMELSKSNGIRARIDNGRIATQSYSTATAAFCPFSIGGGFASSLKCYSAKHWIDNSPVHDFVPCLDPTGAPCMFDLVSKKAFYNKGSGDFLYPADAAPAAAIGMDDKFYAQLTEHGVRRLYKVPDGCNMTKDEYAAANGFKELVEPPLPQTGNWTPHWYETDTQVILEWKETEEPYTEDFNLEQPTEN